MKKQYIAEFIGTFILVLFGCGVAAITSGNIIVTPFAFGLAIVAIAYAIGNISGGHVNPAVSLAMLINKKLSVKDFVGYVISQVLGALAGIGVLYFILYSTKVGTSALGANGYGDLSMTGITLYGAIVTEIVLTAVFVYTILGVTSSEKYEGVAGLVIGLTLAFVHILGIPLTGTSVNPARSLAPALITGGDALSQVWVFICAPLIGAIIAAVLFKFLNESKKKVRK